MSQLTKEEDELLATTPTEELLKLDILKVENINDTLHAYQMAKRCNEKRVMYEACRWGERGYTESLKAEYKGTTVKVIGVYPGGMNTEFWKENRNYISEEKSDAFMNPKDVATVILDNITNYKNLNVADIIIERN